MKRKNLLIISLVFAAFIGGTIIWNLGAEQASAQTKADSDAENLGVVATEYNARNEFALTQGGTTGVWRYGYTANDASNAFVPYTLTANLTACGSPLEQWRFTNSGDNTPVIQRYQSPTTCNGMLPDSLFVHPGISGERSVLRWVAPASGTYQLTGVLQKADSQATTDIKILRNETTSLFTGSIGAVYQQAFNLTVTVAANDTIDFSVGWGNGTYNFDGSSLNVTVSQPVAACQTAPANLQVNVPAENSPSDVQSVNTNASLVGDATYTNMGKVGRAFDFDGNGDYVRIEDNAAQRPATAFTVEAWAKFDSIAGVPHIVSKPLRSNDFNSYALYLQDGTLRGFLGNNSGQYTRVFSNFTPQLGVWHHLAFTYNYTGGVSTLKLYANGVEVTSGQDGTSNLPLFYDANPYPLLIGGELENNTPTYFLDGQADEVSVYGRALSQPEIFDIVQQGSFGKCPNAPCTQAPQGLVSWYQAESNALDSKSNNHGVLLNGATFSNGRVGQAFSLDGVNDYVAAPDSASLNVTGDLTIEAWVSPAQIQAGDVTLVDKRDPSNNNITYVLFLRSGQLQFASRSGGGAFIENFSGITLTAGVFSHVAVTIQNGTLKFYVNGVAAGSVFSQPATRSASTGRLTVGATETSVASGFFNGLIDEISIYNRALSATEIQSIIGAGQSGKCKPVATNTVANLIGFWTGDGDTRDFAGEDQNGTNNGATFAVGKVGQSFSFNADPQNVSIPDSAAMRPTNFTIETWAKSTTLSGIRHIFAKTLSTGTADSYVFWQNGGSMNAAICSSSSTCDTITTSSFNTGEWHHVAFTFDDAGDSLRLYVDGVLAASGTTTLSPAYDTHPVLIGADFANEVISDSWRGSLDEVSFYNRALSDSEIAAVYNAGAAGKIKAKTVNIFTRTTAEKSSVSQFVPATVQLSDATVTFANLTSSGTVSENGIDLGLLPPLPSSVTFTGLAYDISTTAAYQNGSPDNVQVCFNVPSLSASFANLRILHLENGVWVNRTMPVNTSPNLCTDNLTSLSPFAIVQGLSPTAATVSVGGRVVNQNGVGLARVAVSITDTEGRIVSTITNGFGYYRFDSVEVGDTYFISVHSKRFEFVPDTQAVNIVEDVDNVDFTATSDMLKSQPTTKSVDDREP